MKNCYTKKRIASPANREYRKNHKHTNTKLHWNQILIQHHVLVFGTYIKKNMLNNPVKWHFKVIFLYKRATILQFCGLKKTVHTHCRCVYVSIHYIICTQKYKQKKKQIEIKHRIRARVYNIYSDVCISNKRSVTQNTRSVWSSKLWCSSEFNENSDQRKICENSTNKNEQTKISRIERERQR